MFDGETLIIVDFLEVLHIAHTILYLSLLQGHQ